MATRKKTAKRSTKKRTAKKTAKRSTKKRSTKKKAAKKKRSDKEAFDQEEVDQEAGHEEEGQAVDEETHRQEETRRRRPPSAPPRSEPPRSERFAERRHNRIAAPPNWAGKSNIERNRPLERPARGPVFLRRIRRERTLPALTKAIACDKVTSCRPDAAGVRGTFKLDARSRYSCRQPRSRSHVGGNRSYSPREDISRAGTLGHDAPGTLPSCV